MGIAADEARQTTVFIAGGGPVGLAMSLLMSLREDGLPLPGGAAYVADAR